MGGRPDEGNTMKHTMVRCTAIVALLAAPHLEGCATSGTARELGGREAPRGAVVTVSNPTTLPVRIYLRRWSVDVELGTVQGLSSRTFEIADRFMTEASELQLEAEDRRGVALRSDTFVFGAKRAAIWQVGYRSTQVDVR